MKGEGVGLRSMVQGVGCRVVQYAYCHVQSLGGVRGLKIGCWGLGLRGPDFELRVGKLGFKVPPMTCVEVGSGFSGAMMRGFREYLSWLQRA